MFNQRELLQAKSIGELRAMMTKTGAGWSPKEKKVELIDRYIELTAGVQPDRHTEANPATHSNQTPSRVQAYHNTPEAIQQRLKPFIDRGLELTFSEDGESWKIRRQVGEGKERGADGNMHWYKSYKEDAGTVRQPIDVIARCAMMVMQ